MPVFCLERILSKFSSDVVPYLCFLDCLPFVELSTVIPKSGSVYIYLLTAFNSFHPFFGGLPAFVFFWITCVIIQPCMNAVNAKMFASYSFDILKVFVSGSVLSYETSIQYSLGALSIGIVAGVLIVLVWII